MNMATFPHFDNLRKIHSAGLDEFLEILLHAKTPEEERMLVAMVLGEQQTQVRPEGITLQDMVQLVSFFDNPLPQHH
ncbi:hypothetical protein LIN78_06235 [Leeia sp. TBRC 13508]|uniref:Uncharacterized protein n=1 Tax=Leeia speluncae TaxID=2884804 RepID=A0ABS8D686_9NEIS|nr:hypothetical protein [Leeia speluncae]MCB6183138.1 hypothetical protein [Leeia speluncae]